MSATTAKDIEFVRKFWTPDLPGRDLVNRLADEIERLQGELKQVKERADGELVKRLILPSWDEVEIELVSIYARSPSVREGLMGIYGNIQDRLMLELVLANAAMAGDDDGQEPGEAEDESGLVDPSRIEALLERCDREDAHVPPMHRYLYTSEIRRLLGVEPASTATSWPPLVDDVWRDAQGDDWHAIETKFGVRMRLDGTAGYDVPGHVLHNYGPLQLVKR